LAGRNALELKYSVFVCVERNFSSCGINQSNGCAGDHIAILVGDLTAQGCQLLWSSRVVPAIRRIAIWMMVKIRPLEEFMRMPPIAEIAFALLMPVSRTGAAGGGDVRHLAESDGCG